MHTFALVKKDGHLRVQAEKQYRALEARIGDGEAWVMTLEPEKARRSTRANRYYWGVVLALLGEHLGYDPDDLHEVLAMKFLRMEDDPLTGVPLRKRTPKLSTQEFADYVDRCIRFAAEQGVVIPDADGSIERGVGRSTWEGDANADH